MNARIVGLIILIVLSILLFLFISYAELKNGFSSLVGGSVVAKETVSDGIAKTMSAIDEIL